MTQPRKILFFKFGAMGDVLMTTPLVRQTRRAFPNARLDYLVGEGFESVLQRNPYLDSVSTFDPTIFTQQKPIKLWTLANQIKAEKYDIAFVMDKHWSFALAAWLTGISQRIGFLRDQWSGLFLTQSVPYGQLRHEIHYYLDLLEKIQPANREDVITDFVIDGKLPANIILPENYFVCVNSGGKNLREQSAVRMLPRKLFVDLLTKLHRQHPVVLLGNADDRDWYNCLTLPENIINLAGTLNLEQSTSIMVGSQHVYCTDSGAMHLAGTTKTPLTLFFGPTHPLRKAPLRPNVHSLWVDEPRYDDAYEIYGRLPQNNIYFEGLSLSSL